MKYNIVFKYLNNVAGFEKRVLEWINFNNSPHLF